MASERMVSARIFVCDDEEDIRRYLKKLFEANGLTVETFADGRALLARFKEKGEEPALLLQDVRMPDMDGIEILKKVRSLRPSLPVLVMTAYGTIDSAVEAIKLGAFDYVTKPFPKEKILGLIERALEREILIRENRSLKEELNRSLGSENMVFVSDRFREVFELTRRVAASDSNILILGESGTGKELIASAIHENSRRRGKRYLTINCAALSDTLLESQLFGHVRGAFTGAVSAQKGLMEEADSGTLFLDEIGDVSPALQAKLLRVIQERELMPVGSTTTKNVDVRFVAATNKDLEKEVREGRFREDLYYRLNVISINLPPLRDRVEDIGPLALFFAKRFAGRMNKNLEGIDQEALAALQGYHWPGNVRELENVIERGVILADGPLLTARSLPMPVPLRAAPAAAPPPANGFVPLSDVERDHIRHVLQLTRFHKSKTAEILGISRKTLDRKIAEYGFEAEREN